MIVEKQSTKTQYLLIRVFVMAIIVGLLFGLSSTLIFRHVAYLKYGIQLSSQKIRFSLFWMSLLYSFVYLFIVAMSYISNRGKIAYKHQIVIIADTQQEKAFNVCIESLRLLGNYKIKKNDGKEKISVSIKYDFSKIKITEIKPVVFNYIDLFVMGKQKNQCQIVITHRSYLTPIGVQTIEHLSGYIATEIDLLMLD